MGIPFVIVRVLLRLPITNLNPSQAPSEAEAQCAELARGGKVLVSLRLAFCVEFFLGICGRVRRYGYVDLQNAYSFQTSDVL
jgi:hypothetical protein